MIKLYMFLQEQTHLLNFPCSLKHLSQLSVILLWENFLSLTFLQLHFFPQYIIMKKRLKHHHSCGLRSHKTSSNVTLFTSKPCWQVLYNVYMSRQEKLSFCSRLTTVIRKWSKWYTELTSLYFFRGANKKYSIR